MRNSNSAKTTKTSFLNDSIIQFVGENERGFLLQFMSVSSVDGDKRLPVRRKF